MRLVSTSFAPLFAGHVAPGGLGGAVLGRRPVRLLFFELTWSRVVVILQLKGNYFQ